METKGLTLYLKGDESVGIFPSQWRISGDLFFDTQEEFNDFKTKLTDLWEDVCGERVQIFTDEQLKEMGDWE